MVARLITAFLLTASIATAQVPSFGVAATYGTGLTVGNPENVAIADLNGDAIPDVIAGDFNGFCAVFRGVGGGVFAPYTLVDAGEFGVVSIAVLDVNTDGKLDLLSFTSDRYSCVLGDGTGQFGPQSIHYYAPLDVRHVVVRDMNADGIVDAVAATSVGVSVLLGQGGGVFGPPTNYPVVGGSSFVAIADLNLDGRLDVLAAVPVNIAVFFGAGLGTLSPPQMSPTNVWLNFAVGDINLDGKQDVVTDRGDILLGDGTSALWLVATLPTATPGYGMTLVDVNGDGKLDAIRRNEDTLGGVDVFVGNGQGLFSSAVNFPAPSGRGLALVDVEGEGSADIISAGSNSVTVRLNLVHLTSATTAYCFGDGTSAACPCGASAAGNGCPNSITASGARLGSIGYAGVTYDTFKLVGTGVPNGPGLYFQGTGTTDLPFFGDGKFCAGIGVVRLGVTFATGNSSSYPDAVLTTPIHTAGSVIGGGALRYYQVWYRDTDPAFCTPSLFNLTNGLNVAWVP